MKQALLSYAALLHDRPPTAAGDIRVGPVMAIPSLLAELGVPPQRVFGPAGVEPHVFEDAENRLPLAALGKLLLACVAQTGRPDFGLLVGERFELGTMGALGYLLRHSATVGDALRNLVLHLHLHDRGAAPLLLAGEGGSVLLGYSIFGRDLPASGQLYDTAVAIGYRILAELCGPAWRPRCVQLSHPAPDRIAAYRRLFGSTVAFDAAVSGIVFDDAWLDGAIVGAEPVLHELALRAIGDVEARVPMRFDDRVRACLQQLVLGGNATSAALAGWLGIHERTLRRRLQNEGTGLRELVARTRFEIACQLLENTGLSIAALATALHYDDANAFSRAFRGWAGVSPTQWRASHSARRVSANRPLGAGDSDRPAATSS